jgi:hypothetical protein
VESKLCWKARLSFESDVMADEVAPAEVMCQKHGDRTIYVHRRPMCIQRKPE